MGLRGSGAVIRRRILKLTYSTDEIRITNPQLTTGQRTTDDLTGDQGQKERRRRMDSADAGWRFLQSEEVERQRLSPRRCR